MWENEPLTKTFCHFRLEWFNVSRALTLVGDLKGRISVLDFFTYCCINCMHILPDLECLEDKHPPENGEVLVVGVHSAKFENERVSANIEAAIQKYDIHHPVVNDSQAKLWKHLGISCWPTLLILACGLTCTLTLQHVVYLHFYTSLCSLPPP
ncbi:NHL repeat-containing protein 2 [Halocaridina rubra]|uniref:NHL repeat-containing protein 2 n=1 Tax=Halocaridina rubra TaxID=373956 RepID=A0AAN8WKV3_HALRR